MSAPEQVGDLYEQLAHHNVREMAERLTDKPAGALEEAAAALACAVAVYAKPGGQTDERWQQQIAQLTAIAAAVEQLADFGRR